MTRWRERAEELLYDGESVEETVEMDGARVVATGHRLLAFAPDTAGATFRQVDRPNVTGVDTGAQSAAGLLEYAVVFGVAGVVLVVAGALLDFLRNLDVYVQPLGALALLFAVFFSSTPGETGPGSAES